MREKGIKGNNKRRKKLEKEGRKREDTRRKGRDNGARREGEGKGKKVGKN